MRQTSITFHLKRSKLLIGVLLLIHAGASICAWFSFDNYMLKVLLIGTCFVSLYYELTKYWWRKHKFSVRTITQHADGNWQIQTSNKLYLGIIGKDCFVSNFLVILHFRLLARNKANLFIPIFQDSEDKEILRRLRVIILETFA